MLNGGAGGGKATDATPWDYFLDSGLPWILSRIYAYLIDPMKCAMVQFNTSSCALWFGENFPKINNVIGLSKWWWQREDVRLALLQESEEAIELHVRGSERVSQADKSPSSPPPTTTPSTDGDGGGLLKDSLTMPKMDPPRHHSQMTQGHEVDNRRGCCGGAQFSYLDVFFGLGNSIK